MPAPGVTTILEDQSQIQQIVSPATDNTDRPILMVASSADKGFEEWKAKVFGQDFFDIYGEAPSFIKHGQALIQASNAIKAGAYVTFKRVVAEDSTLANIGVGAIAIFFVLGIIVFRMAIAEERKPVENDSYPRIKGDFRYTV